MFYHPYEVQSVADQIQKWVETVVWAFTPIPFLIFVSNLLNYAVDRIFMWGKRYNTFPHMYRNLFCMILMNNRFTIELVGILKYYDMFSLRGYYNFL